MKINNFKFILFCLLITLISCNTKSKESNSLNSENISKSDSADFISALNKNKKEMTGTTITETLYNSNFFKSNSSEEKEYILFFNYYIDNIYGNLSEGMGNYTYKMFVNYPSKYLEMNHYLSFLNKEQKDSILQNITIHLTNELYFRDTIQNVDKTDFAKMFPFLNQDKYLNIFEEKKNELYQ